MSDGTRAKDLRLDPRYVQKRLRDAGLRARHNLSQNFLADVEILGGSCAKRTPSPGAASWRSGRASGSSPAGCSRWVRG